MVQRVDEEYDLHIYRWYDDERMIGGKIEEVGKVLAIIEKDGANINLILQPTKIKTFWSTQHPEMLKQLTDSFQLDVSLPTEELKVLAVPLGSTAFCEKLPPQEV